MEKLGGWLPRDRSLLRPGRLRNSGVSMRRSAQHEQKSQWLGAFAWRSSMDTNETLWRILRIAANTWFCSMAR
jgi:hypothetical protein